MEEPGQRVGRRGVPSEDGLRRLIAAWASDAQTGVPAGEDTEAPALDGRLLQVVIGGGAFAFPLAAVTEVVPYAPPRRLPGQPVEAGVTMLRGEPLPTLDAAARMGMEVDDTAGRMVVLATRDGPCAVVVERDRRDRRGRSGTAGFAARRRGRVGVRRRAGRDRGQPRRRARPRAALPALTPD
jgi:CheW-like protein